MLMSVKTSNDIEGMRLAGKRAAEVLEMIEPHVKEVSVIPLFHVL